MFSIKFERKHNFLWFGNFNIGEPFILIRRPIFSVFIILLFGLSAISAFNFFLNQRFYRSDGFRVGFWNWLHCAIMCVDAMELCGNVAIVFPSGRSTAGRTAVRSDKWKLFRRSTSVIGTENLIGSCCVGRFRNDNNRSSAHCQCRWALCWCHHASDSRSEIQG